MSRIGRQPVVVPEGVAVSVVDRSVTVSGPEGELKYELRPEVDVALADDGRQAVVTRKADDRASRAYHGLTRALLQNMVQGVKQKYEKRLEIVGVGYIAAIKGDVLQLRVGYANEIHKKIPEGLQVTCPDQTHVVVRGCNKQQVGQFASEVRAVRKPEPYKGKGVRYQGEQVKIKAGKSAT